MQNNAKDAEKMFFSDDFASTAAKEAEKLVLGDPPDDDKNKRGAEDVKEANDGTANEPSSLQAAADVGEREKDG